MKDNDQEELRAHLEAFLQNREVEGLKETLEANSNLPGLRANLELAATFAEHIANYAEAAADPLWDLCVELVGLSPEVAPVNDPKEFIPFCGAVGIGAIGSRVEVFYGKALATLRDLSVDPRWRMREAVRMGLQRLLNVRKQETIKELQRWIPKGTPLEMRAVAAAIADPELSMDQEFAGRALGLHKEILDQIVCMPDRKIEDFRVLRKALGYTLSILACALPEDGFGLIDKLISSKDSDLRWIAKSNLKKRRLVRRFPEEVGIRLKGL